jgi:hypothetical protein
LANTSSYRTDLARIFSSFQLQTVQHSMRVCEVHTLQNGPNFHDGESAFFGKKFNAANEKIVKSPISLEQPQVSSDVLSLQVSSDVLSLQVSSDVLSLQVSSDVLSLQVSSDVLSLQVSSNVLSLQVSSDVLSLQVSSDVLSLQVSSDVLSSSVK